MELGGLLLYSVSLVTFAGIFAIITLGLNLNWGMTGLFNVGIAGFFAVGAYVSSILTAPPSGGQHLGGFDLPVPVGLVAAMVMAAAVAWAVGRICLRLRSDYLAIATIGIAEILRLFARNEQSITGGAFGIKGIPRPFESLSRAWSEAAFMLLVLVLMGAVYVFMERARVSPWGRVMRAIRDNETAAAAMGKNIEAFRLQAFVIGSSFMGLGGALTAHYLKVLTPEATEPLVATFLIWVMLIAGGSGNNKGAMLGALVVWALWTATELFSGYLQGAGQIPLRWNILGWRVDTAIDFEQLALRIAYLRMFLVGLLLVVVLQRFPGGLLPERAPKLVGKPR